VRPAARIATLLLGIAAAIAAWGCALRWDESGSSGTVIDFRTPAPCAAPVTEGGGTWQTAPIQGGSSGGDAPRDR
jgi:hypothetical protein